MVSLEPTLQIRHGAGACPVYIGRGLLARLGELAGRHCPGRRLAVISDDRVAAAVPVPLDAPRLTFPAGERSKHRDQWARLTDLLLEAGFGRDSALLAVGGGVTGDLAGFVAATYLRGVPLIQVPTSLLAMLDASIGGKTGVSTPAGKNLVGAFHQPAAVVADPDVLATLPPAERRQGLAEAVKAGLVADAAQFGWLEEHAAEVSAGDPDRLEDLIRRSVPIKAAVVEADERETGLRAILNAGHTVAHAIEAATGHAVPHGEAVAMGLVVETRLAERLGIAADGTAARVESLLQRLGLPVRPPAGVGSGQLLALMRADKKNRRGTVRFSLPTRIGAMAAPDDAWTVHVPEAEFSAEFSRLL